MAGLDGIQNKIHPGEAMDKDLYDLPAEEAAAIPQVCHSFDQALEALDADRDFLTAGGVFSDDMISAFINLKMEPVKRAVNKQISIPSDRGGKVKIFFKSECKMALIFYRILCLHK